MVSEVWCVTTQYYSVYVHVHTNVFFALPVDEISRTCIYQYMVIYLSVSQTIVTHVYIHSVMHVVAIHCLAMLKVMYRSDLPCSVYLCTPWRSSAFSGRPARPSSLAFMPCAPRYPKHAPSLSVYL